MNKLSREDRIQVFRDGAEALRKTAAERDLYRDEFLKLAKRQEVLKLAQDMIDKGYETGDPEEIADRLEKSVKEGTMDLDVTKRAVELSGPNMFKRASLTESTSGTGDSSVSRDALVNFVIS